MAYATVQDLIDRFGEAEVKQLAPAATPALGFDQARLSGALDDASAEADSYLAVRFTVPLDPVPPLVVTQVCAMARQALDRSARQPVSDAASRARAWFKDAGAGRVSLGAGPVGQEDVLPASEGGPAVASADEVFTDATLGSFLR